MGSSEISLANVASGLTCLAVRGRFFFARVSRRSVENVARVFVRFSGSEGFPGVFGSSRRSVENVARGFGDFDATKWILKSFPSSNAQSREANFSSSPMPPRLRRPRRAPPRNPLSGRSHIVRSACARRLT